MGCSNYVLGETFLTYICTWLPLYCVALWEVLCLWRNKSLRFSRNHHHEAVSDTRMGSLGLKVRYSCACDGFPSAAYSEMDHPPLDTGLRPLLPSLIFFFFWEVGRVLLCSPRIQIFISSTSATKCLDHTWVWLPWFLMAHAIWVCWIINYHAT